MNSFCGASSPGLRGLAVIGNTVQRESLLPHVDTDDPQNPGADGPGDVSASAVSQLCQAKHKHFKTQTSGKHE